MAFVFSLSDIELIKGWLAQRLPHARAGDRVEAMARGFGRRTYAALRADLKDTPDLLTPDDAVFRQYLIAKGTSDVPTDLLSSLVEELEEIDGIAKREMLSSMPDTIDEFMEEMGAPGGPPYVLDWAVAFGSVEKCYCGATVIQPGQFANEVISYYEVGNDRFDEVYTGITVALVHSGQETGDGGMGGDLCSYHAHQAAKGD
jgi:hypothetical protein